MNDRQRILDRVRNANASLPERTALPDWDPSIARSRKADVHGDAIERFRQRFEAIHGQFLNNEQDLKSLLQREQIEHAYRAPEVLKKLDWSELESVTHWQETYTADDLDRIGASVTQAAGIIVETGTVILHSRDSANRLVTLAPWLHVAICPSNRIYQTVEDALLHLGNDRYVIWVTGPSKTADIEGILIEGVHGPGVQAVLIKD